MTHYATCVGCAVEGGCWRRDEMRQKLAGLRVTSIKWRCEGRVDRFERGAPVWVITPPDLDKLRSDAAPWDEGHPIKHTFPGFVVRQRGCKTLVYIAEGAPSQDDDETFFKGGPFCMIPLSRISARAGDPEEMCRHCDRPSFEPHAIGYRCNPGSDGWTSGWPHEKDLPL